MVKIIEQLLFIVGLIFIIIVRYLPVMDLFLAKALFCLPD
jgi:hypothetical protein